MTRLTTALTALAACLTPGALLAHGGHPHVAEGAHALTHALPWLAVPAIVGAILLYRWGRDRS